MMGRQDRDQGQLFYEFNLDEVFFEAEVPWGGGRPRWHLQSRTAVNLRQLLQTNTIEFRHFPGTLDPNELKTCLLWCKQFLICALEDSDIKTLLDWARHNKFPTFPLYEHDLEIKYRATTHDGSLTKDQIKQNIDRILNGTFDEPTEAPVNRAGESWQPSQALVDMLRQWSSDQKKTDELGWACADLVLAEIGPPGPDGVNNDSKAKFEALAAVVPYTYDHLRDLRRLAWISTARNSANVALNSIWAKGFI
jgi:hypothetical protein